MGFMKKLRLKAYPTISRYFSHTALVEGKLKYTEEAFRCLFIDNVNFKSYMLPRMYEGAAVSLKTGNIWIPRFKTVLQDYSDSIDMCLAVPPREYMSEFEKLAHLGTHWSIPSFVDTSGDWKETKKRFHTRKRKFSDRMDKDPMFSCRFSNDLKDFDFFYYEMHKPHIQKRFGDLSELGSYDQAKDFFLDGGFVVLIKEAGKTVAGGLCAIQDNTLFMHSAGIRHGNEEYLKRGALSAEYYFTLKYASEHGISKVDLGPSKPFFNDGVHKTKREWGATFYPVNPPKPRVFFFIPEMSKKVVKFFENNPLIVPKEDKIYGFVGWTGEDHPSAKDEKELTKRYYSPGLDGLMLIRPCSKNPLHIPFSVNT